MNILFVGNPDCGMTKDWYAFLRTAFAGHNIVLFDATSSILNCRGTNRLSSQLLKVWAYLRLMAKFINVIKHEKIDIIHFNGAYFFILNFISLFFGGKIVVSPQGSEINEQCIGYHRKIVRFLFRRASTITVRSEFMKRLTVDILERDDKISFLTWGLDDRFFDDSVLSTRPAAGSIPKIVSLRATGKIYNIDKIFEAVKELKNEGYDFVFSYVEFNKESDIELDLGICDNVYRELSQQEVLTLLASNDCMISVPSYDGFSASIMEALAVGTLPVISDLVSYKGEFENEALAAKTGIDSHIKLKNTLAAILSNIEGVRQNVNIRREFAKNRYTRDVQAGILADVYGLNR